MGRARWLAALSVPLLALVMGSGEVPIGNAGGQDRPPLPARLTRAGHYPFGLAGVWAGDGCALYLGARQAGSCRQDAVEFLGDLRVPEDQPTGWAEVSCLGCAAVPPGPPVTTGTTPTTATGLPLAEVEVVDPAAPEPPFSVDGDPPELTGVTSTPTSVGPTSVGPTSAASAGTGARSTAGSAPPAAAPGPARGPAHRPPRGFGALSGGVPVSPVGSPTGGPLVIGGAAPPASATPPVRSAPARTGRPWRTVAAVGILTLLGLVGAVLVARRRNGRPAEPAAGMAVGETADRLAHGRITSSVPAGRWTGSGQGRGASGPRNDSVPGTGLTLPNDELLCR